MSESETLSFQHRTPVEKHVVVVSEHRDVPLGCEPETGLDTTTEAVHVEYADSVDAAKNLISSTRPDLVIVDTRLIGSSPQGIELEGWLSEQAATRALKVVWCRPD